MFAHSHFSIQVSKISRQSDGQFVVKSHSVSRPSNTQSQTYGAVILAAPYHLSSISLDIPHVAQIPAQPYVHQYVTLFTTTADTALGRYFHAEGNETIPQTVLTTFEGPNEVKPEFSSLGYYGKLKAKGSDDDANLNALHIGNTQGRDESGQEWVVKIFSDHKISDAWLHTMFNGQVGWVYRTEVSPEAH